MPLQMHAYGLIDGSLFICFGLRNKYFFSYLTINTCILGTWIGFFPSYEIGLLPKYEGLYICEDLPHVFQIFLLQTMFIDSEVNRRIYLLDASLPAPCPHMPCSPKPRPFWYNAPATHSNEFVSLPPLPMEYHHN